MEPYGDWDLEAVQDMDDGAETHSNYVPPASSFTPINRPVTQLLTPQSSTFTPIAAQPPQWSRGKQPGKRDYQALTSGSGYGVATELPHLEKDATALPPTPSTQPRNSKRNRKTQGPAPLTDSAGNVQPARQTRKPYGPRVTRIAAKKSSKQDVTTSLGLASSSEVSRLPSTAQHNTHTPAREYFQVVLPLEAVNQTHNKPEAASARKSGTRSPGQTGYPSTATVLTTARDTDAHYLPDFDSQNTMAEDEFDAIFNEIDIGDTNAYTTDVKAQTVEQMHPQHLDEGVETSDYQNMSEYDTSDECLMLLTAISTDTASSHVQSAKDRRPVDKQCRDMTQKPHLGKTQRRDRRTVLPITATANAVAQEPATSSEEQRKPIVRPAFPAPVRDRSPIIGLSSSVLLRTCFRIGEAINQASRAAKSGQKVIFELYARVLSSQRSDVKHDFVFRDLFHAKPPYLKGVYDAVIWRSVRLYEYDSERLLEEQRMCRCIGTMKRNGKDWVMVVLNAWEAKWEDIAWVEGIVKT